MFSGTRYQIFSFIKRVFSLINLSIVEKIYVFILSLFFIYSLIYSIPTTNGSIGIASDLLQIGDRSFYINDSSLGYDYEEFYGNFLYPFILGLIKKLSNFFGQTSTSRFFNFIIVSITSLLSIISLRLLILSSKKIFNAGVSNYASLLYVINPYSYFFPLTGGLTNYVLFCVALITFIVARRKHDFLNYKNVFFLKDLTFCLFICLCLSSLRPTGGFFAICFVSITLIKLLSAIIRINRFNITIITAIILSMATLSFTIINLLEVQEYIFAHISIFLGEGGLFFGYPRDGLRKIISEIPDGFFYNFKSILYTLIWKSTNFVSGISGISDTYNFSENRAIFPFIARTFAGVFIIYPINLISVFGVLSQIRIARLSNIWIVLLSSIISTLPCFLGVAVARYWIMFYLPFLIFAGALIYNIKNEYKILDVQE